MAFRIKNWEKFQHYQTGRGAPPWVKLYRDILNDKEWFKLPPDAAKFLVSCWLLAAETAGALPDSDTIAFRLRLASNDVDNFLTACSHWVISDASDLLANHYQVASTETETETETYKEETETEIAIAPKKSPVRASQIPADFYPNENGIAYAENKKLSLAVELESFRNFHTAKGSTWKDWQATWRTWCDKAVEFGRAGKSSSKPGYQSIHDQRANTIAILTGKKSHERTIADERDITGESVRVA